MVFNDYEDVPFLLTRQLQEWICGKDVKYKEWMNMKNAQGKLIALMAISMSLLACGCAHPDVKGVFSNAVPGGDHVSLIVHDSGYALLVTAPSLYIAKWTYDEPASAVDFQYYDHLSGTSIIDKTFRLFFDPKNRAYSYTVAGTEDMPDYPNKLRYVTNEIPSPWIDMLKVAPEDMEEDRERAWLINWKKRQEREKPEYDRILSSIAGNPQVVLSPEFYGTNSPANRVLGDSLENPEIPFTDEVLVGIMNRVLPGKRWDVVKAVLTRRELTGQSIDVLYPKILAMERRIAKERRIMLANSPDQLESEITRIRGITDAIAANPNAGINVIEDIATRDDASNSTVVTAQRRVLENTRATLAAGNVPAKAITHMYEVANRMAVLRPFESGQDVFRALVEYSGTPEKIIAKLAAVDDPWVQEAVAAKPNVPVRVLNSLESSKYDSVRAKAKQVLSDQRNPGP